VEEILELQREEQLAKREQREKRRKAHLDRGQHDVRGTCRLHLERNNERRSQLEFASV
jgi:hypothetical protein